MHTKPNTPHARERVPYAPSFVMPASKHLPHCFMQKHSLVDFIRGLAHDTLADLHTALGSAHRLPLLRTRSETVPPALRAASCRARGYVLVRRVRGVAQAIPIRPRALA